MFKRMKEFFVRQKAKVCVAVAAMSVMLTGIMSFAAEPSAAPVRSPTPIPTGGTFSLGIITELWDVVAGMAMDTIQIIASQPMLVMMCIAVPLIGIGVGIFGRIKRA